MRLDATELKQGNYLYIKTGDYYYDINQCYLTHSYSSTNKPVQANQRYWNNVLK